MGGPKDDREEFELTGELPHGMGHRSRHDHEPMDRPVHREHSPMIVPGTMRRDPRVDPRPGDVVWVVGRGELTVVRRTKIGTNYKTNMQRGSFHLYLTDWRAVCANAEIVKVAE